MIDVNEVETLLGIYKSQLYKDFYAVDFLLKRGGCVFKIRYPYKTKEKANVAFEAIKNKQQKDLLQPDYRPYIWLMVKNNIRTR